MVLEFGFHVDARTKTAGEQTMDYVVDDRNRLLRDGSQIVR